MASNQAGRQAAARAIGGTELDYNGDFHGMFTVAGIASGPFNSRFLDWLNLQLGVTYTSLPGAMQAYAVSLGFNNWDSLNTLGGFAPPVLTLTSGSSPNPTFNLDLDEAAAEGHNLRLQVASDLAFTVNLTTTDHPITSGEIASGEINFGLDPLTTGTWYARVRHESSPWSNTVTMNIVAGTGEPYGLLLVLTKP